MVDLPALSRQSVRTNVSNNEVDLYRLNGMAAGDVLELDVRATSGNIPYPYVRLFDSTGRELDVARYDAAAPGIRATVSAAGDYYVGVSGYNNYQYDPTTAGSGTGGTYTGEYRLSLLRQDGGATSLSSIDATASSGTAARAALASANTGQLITLRGQDLRSSDRVVITTLDSEGRLGSVTLVPASVSADGSSLTVTVPSSASSGMVRLERKPWACSCRSCRR